MPSPPVCSRTCTVPETQLLISTSLSRHAQTVSSQQLSHTFGANFLSLHVSTCERQRTTGYEAGTGGGLGYAV